MIINAITNPGAKPTHYSDIVQPSSPSSSSTVLAMARSASVPGVAAALNTIDPLVTPVLDPFVDGLMEPLNEVHACALHTRVCIMSCVC